MSDKNIRVRFAPSPTGPLHMGGVRTALYNYLFARKNKGTFILRIEDTDQKRFVKGSEDYIIEALKWCGIKTDEGIPGGGDYGPYNQSERKEIYPKYIKDLLELGDAYYAFDTAEDLDKLRKEGEKTKRIFTYNAEIRDSLNNSLNLSPEKVKEKIDSGEPYVIRYKVKPGEILKFQDLIRGDIEVDTGTLDDKVLFKSDGMPTYHLANIVDDHLMKISHVIRGEEWLPSLPLHLLLYRSFNWEPPEFAHMPLTLKPDGKGKLSKRDGDRLGFPVFPLEWKNPETGETSSGYRESGYFPEAFINILAFLGWNPGTEQEIFSMDQLIESFSLERVVKAGSRFDPEKARWFNQQYLREKSDEELAGLFMPDLKERKIDADIAMVTNICGLIKERVSFVKEFWDQSWFFFRAPEEEEYDEKVKKKRWKDNTPQIMSELMELLESLDDFSSENCEVKVKEWAEKGELGLGQVLSPFRLIIVGGSVGPHLFDIIAILGKEETLNRMDKALKMFAV
ncbi:MAG: glutamate--tRNA ligase [Bacteroidales bacterium]|nr:glutamate--tRNA ligase [Bacteroidales bacterium]